MSLLEEIENKEEIENNTSSFIHLVVLSALLWSISHILRIKNKEFHEDFIKNNSLMKDIRHSIRMFDRAFIFRIINSKYKNFNLRTIVK